MKLTLHNSILLSCFLLLFSYTANIAKATVKNNRDVKKLQAGPLPANDKMTLYYTIVGTEVLSLDALVKYKKLKRQFPDLTTVNSDDCGNLKPGLTLFVSEISDTENAAGKTLKQAKTKVKDAYFRRCDIKPDSLALFNVPYLHESLLLLDDTTNWSNEDLGSKIYPIPQGALLEEKRFDIDSDEPVSSQSSLYFINKSTNTHKKLLEYCWQFQYFPSDNNIVFQCVTGTAAETHLIHTVYVFNSEGDAIFSEEYCRMPSLKNNKLICQREDINANLELRMYPKAFDIK